MLLLLLTLGLVQAKVGLVSNRKAGSSTLVTSMLLHLLTLGLVQAKVGLVYPTVQ